MRPLRAWWIRLSGLFTADRRAREFDAELESHLEMHIDDNIRRGMTREEARRQALIALGRTQVRAAHRDRSSVPAIEWLVYDLRFAIRMLRKAPGFTAVAVIVLALGIGANGAIFSLINPVLFKPFARQLRGDLMGLYSGERTAPDFRPFSYPEFVDIRRQNDAFDHLFAEATGRVGLTEDGLTRRVFATYVSSNYFSALRVPMAAGRAFTEEEERPGSAAAVAIASHRYWRRSGMRPDVVGRLVTLNGRPFTIVGVAAEGFNGTIAVLANEFWLPFGASALLATQGTTGFSEIADNRSSFGLMLSGTLNAGLSEDDAEARLVPLAAALEQAYPETNREQRLVVRPRSRVSFGAVPESDGGIVVGALALMTVAGMVLVVACLNLANMLLARGSVRRQEIAVRLAIGGSRGRIMRQLLVEGLLLAMIAGGVALAVAWWAASRLVASIAPVMGTSVFVDVTPDARILVTIAAACLVSTIFFCLGPALKLSRLELSSAMKQAAPLTSRRRRWISIPGLLSASQVALSLALLAGAGVFVRASAHAARSDPGFPLEGGVLAEVDPGIAGMNEAESRSAYGRVLDLLRALPDVRAASAASIVPFGLTRDVRRVRHGEVSITATYTVIGTDYFTTLGLPLVEGREFTAIEERRATDPVAIVDETLALRLLGRRRAVGEFIRLLLRDDVSGEPLRVVGVVPSVRDDLLGGNAAHVYVPFGRQYSEDMTVHVRTTPGLEPEVSGRVRAAIERAEPRLPIVRIRSFETHRDEAPSLWAVVLGARLFGAFGLTAFVLAVVGIYGLRAYLVAQRTREVAVRLALGATRGRVIRQLVREAAALSAVGVAVGLGLAVALVQVIRQSGMLYQVTAVDPIVFTMAPLVLVSALAAASYIPARRALRIDPAVALRPE